MLLASRMAVFLNLIYLQNKMMNSLIFYLLIQILGDYKLIEKYWSGFGHKWEWSVWSQDSKIGYTQKELIE